jgi:hypothetical protein
LPERFEEYGVNASCSLKLEPEIGEPVELRWNEGLERRFTQDTEKSKDNKTMSVKNDIGQKSPKRVAGRCLKNEDQTKSKRRKNEEKLSRKESITGEVRETQGGEFDAVQILQF